jgi:hypothetical protein
VLDNAEKEVKPSPYAKHDLIMVTESPRLNELYFGGQSPSHPTQE